MAIPNKNLDFLILGVGKSGTTSLAAMLAQHSQIAITEPKEPWFFDSRDFHQGMDWYWRRYLGHYRGEPCVGEATSHTLFVPYAAERLHAVAPEARLIAILREPIDRACSDWWMKHCQGTETDDFATAVAENLSCLEDHDRFSDPLQWQAHIDSASSGLKFKTYVDFGCYATQLERYYRVFPEQQILIILTEDLRDAPLATLGKVCRFLGVSDDLDNTVLNLEHRNRAASPRAASLRKAFYALPGSNSLARLLATTLPEKVRNGLLSPLRKLLKGEKPPVPAATRRLLEDFYAGEITRLEQLSGRDLTAWKASSQPGSGDNPR